MGYGSYDGRVLIFDPKTRRVRRSHHAYIDEFNVKVLANEPVTPNTVLLKDYPVKNNPGDDELDPGKVKIVESKIQLVESAFAEKDLSTLVLILPDVKSKLGLTLHDDTIFGIPVISAVDQSSPRLHKNAWVESVSFEAAGRTEKIEPTTAKYLVSKLNEWRKYHEVRVIAKLARAVRTTTEGLEDIRACYDNLLSKPTVNFMMSLPTRPDNPKSLGAALKGPLRIHWINAMKHQYTKNAQQMLLSKPIGRSTIPINANRGSSPKIAKFQSLV
jgi:hypothetical protein